MVDRGVMSPERALMEEGELMALRLIALVSAGALMDQGTLFATFGRVSLVTEAVGMIAGCLHGCVMADLETSETRDFRDFGGSQP